MYDINTFYGPNAGYVLELYERYRQNPSSVDPETRAIFDTWTPETVSSPSPWICSVSPGSMASSSN